jgi:ABC-type nitrate/sulfonate/bicarbonate transport system ATPase subunit
MRTAFALAEGSFVCVVGPSGCEKSTLFNIIAGLQPPSGGAVLIDGDDATGTIGRVGYMLQKDLLLPWRTVLDNVVLGMEIKGVARARARDGASLPSPLWSRRLRGSLSARAVGGDATARGFAAYAAARYRHRAAR